MKNLTILIPVFNEEDTLCTVLDKIKPLQLSNCRIHQIIVVNDGSTDHTEAFLQEYMANNPSEPILYLPCSVNQGKGAAIRNGISHATGDYLIIQDADLEYDPNEYSLLLKPVINGFADVVYGSRFMGGNPHRSLYFWHSVGNRFLTFACNLFSDLNLSDMESGYKLFRTDILKSLHLRENRFGFEPEVTLKLSRIPNIRIYEVGISYYGRTFGEGKKIGWRDGIRALYCILKFGLFKQP